MNLILSEISFLNVNKTIIFSNSKNKIELKNEIIIESNDKILDSEIYIKFFIEHYGNLRFNEFLKNSSICSKFEFSIELQKEMEKLIQSYE